MGLMTNMSSFVLRSLLVFELILLFGMPTICQFDRDVFRGYKREVIQQSDSLGNVEEIVQFRINDTIGSHPTGRYTIKSNVLDSAVMIQNIVNKISDQFVQVGEANIRAHQAKQTGDSLLAMLIKLAGRDVYTQQVTEHLQKIMPGEYWLQYMGQQDSVLVKSNGRIERARNNSLLFSITPKAKNWIALTSVLTGTESVTDVFFYPTDRGRVRWAGISEAGPLILLRRE